jgi:TRAP-type C4-dicarboxylate transport system permease small subunit
MSNRDDGPSDTPDESASPKGGGPSSLGSDLDEIGQRFELTDPDEGLPPADRILNKSVEAVGVAALAAVFLIVLASTLGRYFFNSPLIWAEEVALGIIPWMVAIGIFLSVRYLSRGATQAVGLFSQVLSMGAFAYLAWSAVRYFNFFGSDPTPYLGLPKGLSSSAFVFAGVATGLAFFVGLIRSFMNGDFAERGR